MMQLSIDRPIVAIGQTTRTLTGFVALLRQVDVTLVADVRSFPRSNAMRRFNADALPESPAEYGIGYRHLRALGGRSDHCKGTPPSFNTYWRVMAFRNYSDYAEAGVKRQAATSTAC